MRPNLSLFLRRKSCSILRLFSWLFFWDKVLLENKNTNVPSANIRFAGFAGLAGLAVLRTVHAER